VGEREQVARAQTGCTAALGLEVQARSCLEGFLSAEKKSGVGDGPISDSARGVVG
jgi:hypothetical protein